jgi:hypothetical protein
MIAIHIEFILMITGIITAIGGLQFFLPRKLAKMNFGEEPSSDAAVFLARHWGMLVLCFGALLILASKDEAIRQPVMIAAAVEKAALVGNILATSLRRHPSAIVIAIADTLMTLLYVAYLAGF